MFAIFLNKYFKSDLQVSYFTKKSSSNFARLSGNRCRNIWNEYIALR